MTATPPATPPSVINAFNGMAMDINVTVNNASSATPVAASSVDSGWTPTQQGFDFAMTTNTDAGVFSWIANRVFVRATADANGETFFVTIADTVSTADSIQLYIFWLGGSNYTIVPLKNGTTSSEVTVKPA